MKQILGGGGSQNGGLLFGWRLTGRLKEYRFLFPPYFETTPFPHPGTGALSGNPLTLAVGDGGNDVSMSFS